MGLTKNIAIILLAAGASTRMGQPKQLLPWKSTSLLGDAIRKAKTSKAKSVVVVLGANMESIRKEILENDVEIIENRYWESGLGSSIACGTDFLLKEKNKPNGILIMLADQPMIDTTYLNAMMAAFDQEQKVIIATAYENRAGVPALFPDNYYEELTKLDDDFGAKKIIDNYKENVSILDLGQITVDIDTISDYKKLNKGLN